jgi:putative transposase
MSPSWVCARGGGLVVWSIWRHRVIIIDRRGRRTGGSAWSSELSRCRKSTPVGGGLFISCCAAKAGRSIASVSSACAGRKVFACRRWVSKRQSRSSRGYPVQSAYPGHVWSWDFIMDRTTDGRPVKMLTMVDEYTRQCLLIHPARSITSDQVLDTRQRLTDLRGSPVYIRSDNGSEFIAQIIQDWCHITDVKTLYIEPGSPWQNPFIESFHSRFRDECLNQEIFFSIAETRVVVEDYRRLYNGERLHSSLGYKTPDQFAQNLTVQPADTP